MDTFKHFGIRAATNADAPAIRGLVFGVLAEYGLEPDPAGTDIDLDDIEAGYMARGGWFEVVEDADVLIVGSAGLYPLDSSTCELRKMYLAPQVRGLGLGRHLMERAMAAAVALGFHRMVLETAAVLVEAIALYRQYGFRPYTPEHLAARCDQAYERRLP
ncbi:MAG TPA: GNAT family N-acetyltransferase [Candidatus Hydrogenedentes bacterium]|nr:GNAT family N-acetyltransferase [Candidatus Hydrogenedentota bacterium]HPG69798.1 GNAT family N-acetyltransferase [Candidatus Hydrogenedentota bacterium]